MKILVTGAKGFIGKNLCIWLKNAGYEVLEYDIDSPEGSLNEYVAKCDFIVHLAGVNRPLNEKEFVDGNVNFTKKLLDSISFTGTKSPLIFSSSIQATLNNPYGKSKKMAEEEIFRLGREGHTVYVFRLYNVFGKWCRPNYNSVIATFCYNIAHNIPIRINDSSSIIDFVYIDDVCKSFIDIIEKKPASFGDIYFVEPHYSKTLNEVADLLISFRESTEKKYVPMQEGFSKKLYATYLTYVESSQLSYSLESKKDVRGTFSEFLKIPNYGQISINMSHPGITRGNHYHMTKCEKFLVVCGLCDIKLRRIDSNDIIIIHCSGDDKKVVDIPPGFAHNITNIGFNDSITVIWASEEFDKDKPDTYAMIV